MVTQSLGVRLENVVKGDIGSATCCLLLLSKLLLIDSRCWRQQRQSKEHGFAVLIQWQILRCGWKIERVFNETTNVRPIVGVA